jgi:hypothetical protein
MSGSGSPERYVGFQSEAAPSGCYDIYDARQRKLAPD